MKIKLYFLGFEPEKPTIPLAASLGIGATEKELSVQARRFEHLFATAEQVYERVDSFEAADVCVYCHDFSNTVPVPDEAQHIHKAGKPCVFFHPWDPTKPTTNIPGIVYRYSLLASMRQEHEYVLPAFVDDPFHQTGPVEAVPKSDRPSVGFCGFVGTTWRRMLYRLQGRSRKVLGLTLRSEALDVLRRSARVQNDFILRSKFWGGAIDRLQGWNPDAQKQVREEFNENMARNAYTLCLRGAGNFSFRFYQTLAMGRIPLFVNTDCMLPFADKINWRKHLVWVEQEDLHHLADRLADFHDRLTDDQFQQLQRDNRQLWQDYLSPSATYRHVFREILGHDNV